MLKNKKTIYLNENDIIIPHQKIRNNPCNLNIYKLIFKFLNLYIKQLSYISLGFGLSESHQDFIS